MPKATTSRGGPRWRTGARGAMPYVIAAAAGFLLAYAAVFLFVFPTSLVPDDRPVPDVRGQLADDAERALRAAGFAPRVGERRVDEAVVPNTVVRQAPAPGAQRPKGSEVVFDVAVSP